jgi:ABC-type branched-subunit amino acid transport system ATPase component
VRHPVPAPSDPDSADDGLAVDGLVVRFGGNLAVNRVSFSAPRGRITGLIGPNGAGKTTIFNACTGIIAPAAGTVRLLGEDVTGWSAPRRARAGLGRTFQRMELCNSLTVAENVALGPESRQTGASPIRQLYSTRTARAALADAVEGALEACSLTGLANRPAGTLSTGQRRLVELARVYAGGYAVALLDEPSSGLDNAETERFGGILERLVREQGTGILLVEHDMALVMRVCHSIHVIDFGTHIFAGSPAEVSRSRAVRSAYLGVETDQPVEVG